jgi:hypothetical protein
VGFYAYFSILASIKRKLVRQANQFPENCGSKITFHVLTFR